MRNTFLQKPWGRETSFSRLFVFLKSFIWSKNKRLIPSFQYIMVVLDFDIYTWIWFFKKSSGTSFSIIFCARFSKKMFLKSYSVNWPNLSVLLRLLQELSGNMYSVIVCYSFCLHYQKFRMKTEISQEWKELFRGNEKRFSSFLQDFQFQFLQDFQSQFLQDFQCVFK